MGLRSSDFLCRSRSARHRRAACLFLLATGLTLLTLAGIAISRIPWWIEQRLCEAFLRDGCDGAKLRVTRAGWREINLAGIHLTRPGVSFRAEGAHLEFRPLAFLERDYELLEFTGLQIDLDVEHLLQIQALRLPTSLRALHEGNRYGLIRVHNSQIRLRRGQSEETLAITGKFSTQGPVDATISGSGITEFSLRLQGKVAGDRGDATLHMDLNSPNLATLLEELVPGWLQKNPVYSVDDVQLAASFRFAADRPTVTDAGGILHWKGWRFDNGRIDPARVHLQKQGNAVILQSDTLRLERSDGLSASGVVDATFAPEGSAADTPFLQGRLQVQSWSSPEAVLEPFTVPFSGTPASLRLGPAKLKLPGPRVRTLQDLWVRLENPPSESLRAEGKALLEVPCPTLIPSETAPRILSLPATGRFTGPRENRQLDFTVHVEDARGSPLRFDFGKYFVDLTASLTGIVPPGPAPRSISLQLDLPRMDWRSQDRLLLSIAGLALSGMSENGLLDAKGTGLWEGQPFPLAVRQTSEKNKAVSTSISLGPIPIREATWPGNVIKAWRGSLSSGELLLAGTLLHHPDHPAAPPETDLAFTLRGGKLLYPGDTPTTVSGVEAQARLVSLHPLRFAPGLSVSVDQVNASKLELKNLRLSASMSGPGQVRIDSFEAGMLGGLIRIAEPVVISLDDPNFKVLFDLQRIEGAEAVRLFPKFKGSIDACISGRVPVAVEGDVVRFLEGHLYLDGSEPARLSYDASGFLSAAKGERTRAPKFTQSVERALGNFTIQSLDVRLFDPSDPTHPAIVKIAGLGIDGKLNLPVNLTIPVEDEEGILQSLFSRILSAGMSVLRNQ